MKALVHLPLSKTALGSSIKFLWTYQVPKGGIRSEATGYISGPICEAEGQILEHGDFTDAVW